MRRTTNILQILVLPVVFLTTGFCISQSTIIDKAENLIRTRHLDSALVLLDHFDITKQSLFDSGRYNLCYGKIYRYRDQHEKSIKYLLDAKKYFGEIDSLEQEAYTVYEIIDLGLQQGLSSGFDVKSYIQKFDAYARRSRKNIDLARAKSKFASIAIHENDWKNALIYYDSTIEYLKRLQSLEGTIKIALIETNIGTVYNENIVIPDSALHYLKKAEAVIKKYRLLGYLSTNFNNQAQAYINLCDYKTAILFYEKADSIAITDFPVKTELIYAENKAEAYGAIGRFPEAYQHSNRLNFLKDSIRADEQNAKISEIKEEFDNQKLRADNLESEAKRSQNRNIAFALAALLLLGTIIAFLLQKNTKKKQRIAEQQRELEIQKTEKILKEQELTTIDAMIQGQEKERQRLASDLHDSVGATLAAAKLQFDHISKNKENFKELDELFDKTKKLLNDAYTEVRAMAHIKNSGVLAKNGLLPAVIKLAKNASRTNQLQIDVQDFGLEERLENSLEITVFRIIQELVTNVIKHANASEASISITQHEDSLNIIVEDNGIGFKPKNVNKYQDGMGLDSIERRIEYLEGAMEVDSSKGNGTTIVIDIPL